MSSNLSRFSRLFDCIAARAASLPRTLFTAFVASLLITVAGNALAQQPVAVRIDAIDLNGKSITITFRDTPRTLPIATTIRVAADGREAALGDIPGDARVSGPRARPEGKGVRTTGNPPG